jgi:putative membrane protein insertion efficiency factor
MPIDEPVDTPAAINVAQRILLGGIRGYQLLFAPMYAGACRFTPSCSAYAFEAIERHGAVRGGALAVRRLMRCRPFGGHGHDPVPAVAPSELRRGTPAGLSDSKIY